MFNEQEVITRVLGGDTRAFELLVKQYQRLVYYVIDRLVKDSSDKEDISQEVFVKVFGNLRGFKFRSKLSTWIASIAYRTALNHIRDHKPDSRVMPDTVLGEVSLTDKTPEQLSVNKDMAGYINRLIDNLPIQYRSVLTLYHLNEFTYREIEEITGMPEGTVKNYLFRARKLLKDKLQFHFKDDYLK